MRIERLSERVANRIAAGEVITEPLSVIKELLENSLDAGARRIDIDVHAGGLGKISIRDDGEGIYFEDAPLVFERHATSKLRDVKDLYEVASMGFRGEALASVAAVSKVTLQSRSQQEQQGFEMLNYGGNALSLQRIARDQGTRIDVEDLFYNTPVLANFQKRQATLEANITQFVGAFAVGNPQVAISYTVDHKRVFSTKGEGDILRAILAVFGEDVLSHLLEFSMETEHVRVKGLQSALGYSLSHRRRMIFLVNGRLVENPELKETLTKAYEGLLPARRYPMAILWIETQAKGVDVNLHPRKEHVRLYQEKDILTPLREALRKNLYQERAITKLHPKEQEVSHEPMVEKEEIQQESKPDFSSFTVSGLRQREEEKVEQVSEPIVPYGTLLDELRYIGPFMSTYLLFEARHSVYIMDQHAAHEKILLQTFTRAYENSELYSQGLLMPLTIPLGIEERAAWNVIEEKLTDLGFEADLFGENQLIVRAVPHLFTQSQAKQYLVDFLAGTTSRERLPIEELVLRACKAAIKAGDFMTTLEVTELINSLKQTEDPMTCPHGRPIFVRLTRDELEKRFART